MDEKQFQILSSKIDQIMKLLALNTVKGKELKDQVWLLSSSGFQSKDIADILGKKPSYIRVVLHRLHKEAKKREIEAATKYQAKPQPEEEPHD